MSRVMEERKKGEGLGEKMGSSVRIYWGKFIAGVVSLTSGSV